MPQRSRWLFLLTGSPTFPISGFLGRRAYCVGCCNDAFSILLEPPGFPFQLFPQGRIRGGFKCELWSCSLVLSPFLQLVSQVYCISVADQYLLCHQKQVSEPRPHLNPALPSCTANTSSLSFLSSATPVQWRCEISCNESIPSTTHSLIPSLSCFKAVPCVCVSAEVNIWCPVGYATSRAEAQMMCVAVSREEHWTGESWPSFVMMQLLSLSLSWHSSVSVSVQPVLT